jgi:hypothetical protein
METRRQERRRPSGSRLIQRQGATAEKAKAQAALKKEQDAEANIRRTEIAKAMRATAKAPTVARSAWFAPYVPCPFLRLDCERTGFLNYDLRFRRLGPLIVVECKLPVHGSLTQSPLSHFQEYTP